MQRRRWFFLSFLGFAMAVGTSAAWSQTAIGLKAQAYPAGVIVGGQAAFSLNENMALRLFIGYNSTDRRDWGEHDDEQGGGAGFGVAGRYYWGDAHDGWHLGLRTDLWFLTIDWQQGTQTGQTEVTVLQPTAQLGYTFVLGKGRWIFEPTLALGVEVNVQTTGEAVGQGAIFLVGAGWAYRF